MIISRRPKRRASTENAPGPSVMMASRIVTAKTTDRYESNRVRVQTGSNENPMPVAPNPITTPTNGVAGGGVNRPLASERSEPSGVPKHKRRPPSQGSRLIAFGIKIEVAPARRPDTSLSS
jgi:hypothetical protein